MDAGGFRGWLEKAIRVEEEGGADWSKQYVDYARFKKRLKFFARRRAQIRTMLRNSSDATLEEHVVLDLLGPKTRFPANDPGRPRDGTETDNYIRFESGEAEFSFDETSQESGGSYLKKKRNQGSIMRRLSISERNEIMVFLEQETDKARDFYYAFLKSPHTVEENLELMCFCVINVICVQQILVRYDAFVRAFEGSPMLEYYTKKMLKHPTSFRKLLYHEELSNLINVMADPDMKSQMTMFQEILENVTSQDKFARHKHVKLSDAIIYGTRKWILRGLFEERLGLEPAYLTARGQSLEHEMERLAEWRKQKASIQQESVPEKELSERQVFNLTLNLLSAFLYCMNYYIVEPSSTMYVNRLGAHDAMSGTLIGMMPLAAFVSSIPYSMWTNRSFRHPFMASCFFMVLGNLLYSLADQFSVVGIALVGRFIAGLGAPKCIIRRYMADTTPVSLRTSVNAGFGMVVAAGSAMGPAMAILLNRFEHTHYVPHLGLVTLNGLTLPGYLMACLWLTFGIVVLATFEEPDREGLKEQQELEARGVIPFSPSNVTQDSAKHNEDLMTIFSGDSSAQSIEHRPSLSYESSTAPKWWIRFRHFCELITLPVRICLALLFCKVFTIETLVSATSALTKNRYKWQVQQVGTLGLTNGLLVIPFSVMVGKLSMSYQDHQLMKWLVGVGCFGMFLLVDLTDLGYSETGGYNEGHVLAVTPHRYILGYFLSYLSIQAFEGVIGSTLSKVIPTALASGTFNSGLLATLVDTFGRTCGDLFISAAGFVSLRQLMNLLFIPGFSILLTCFIVIVRCRDMLAV